MAALVIGSMVPDVPLFLRWSSGYRVSHSYAGAVTADLVGALLLLFAWNGLFRDALVDLAPAAVRSRLPARQRLSLRQWLLAPAAAALGSLTHVAWDSFTHPGRWGVLHVAWLRTNLGPLPMFKWAQYASGVIGLVVVLGAIIADLRSRPATQPARSRTFPSWLLPLVVCAAAGYGIVAGLDRWGGGFHAVAFRGVVRGIVALAAGASITCLAWLLVARIRPPQACRGRARRSRGAPTPR